MKNFALRHALAVWIAILIMGVVGTAHAGSVALTWIAPTTNIDNTPIVGAITYRVFGGVQAQTKTLLATVTGTSYTHTSAPNGTTYCYVVRAVVGGVESADSNERCTTIPASVPNPPTNLVIGVVTGLNMSPVYRIMENGQRGTTVIGFVPIGSQCYGDTKFTYRGRGYKKVEQSKVVWWGTSATPYAAAACS